MNKVTFMRRLIILGSIILGILFTNENSIAQTPRKYLKIGNNFFKKQNYADAITQYSKAIALNPNFVKAYIARATVYEKIDSTKKAAIDYRRASVFIRKNSDVLCKSGILFNSVGNYNEALEMLDLATLKNKKNALCFSQKAYSYLQLKKYHNAIGAADSSIKLEKTDITYYYRGLAYFNIDNYLAAENDFTTSISLNRKNIKSYLARAELYLEQEKLDYAMNDVNVILGVKNKNVQAYLLRSEIYVKQLEYPNAINDISKILIIEPDSTGMYIVRGKYYQQFNQHANAITDFSKAIGNDSNNPMLYFLRAKSYEEILDYKKAIKDYKTLGDLSKYDGEAMRLKDKAEARLFELNREKDSPHIRILFPILNSDNAINVAKGKTDFLLKGQIDEQNTIKELRINGEKVDVKRRDGNYVFISDVSVNDSTSELNILAIDAYDNKEEKSYKIVRTEINRPEITILAPYASDDGEIYLSSEKTIVYVEGKIVDESHISSIMIDGVLASYKPDNLNPTFNANINLLNKNKFTISVTDEFGNVTSQIFMLNRDGVISDENPMGKTWVVFISNSEYETFASLEGPKKDLSTLKSSLANYQISNIITKENMTKLDFEKFFSIELRNLVRSNQVNSLMIWYAGHGKSVNDVGYWIPVDATRDDEFSFYNVNQLKVALEAYTKYIVHTLVVTDACESGPTFYQAMRGTHEERDCNDWKASRSKSSQVFSSAGYEEASDNSQFSRTFANALANNPKTCIPIESIVTQVTSAVQKNNQQKPQFGKISGMEDENGTFFFISK